MAEVKNGSLRGAGLWWMIWIRWKHHSHSKTLPDLSLVNSSLTKATTSTVPLPVWATGYSTFPYTGGVGSSTPNPPKQKKKSIYLYLISQKSPCMGEQVGFMFCYIMASTCIVGAFQSLPGGWYLKEKMTKLWKLSVIWLKKIRKRCLPILRWAQGLLVHVSIMSQYLPSVPPRRNLMYYVLALP